MLRPLILATVACFAIAMGAGAEGRQSQRTRQDGERATPARQDPFVIADDSCGASRFAHLLGENYARVYQASLIPSNSNRLDRIKPITLEYTPYRLNFVVGGEGRIIAVGCF